MGCLVIQHDWHLPMVDGTLPDMDDLPATPDGESENAISKVMRSDLPDDQKRRIISQLMNERQAFERKVSEEADNLIAEAERHLREQ